MAERFFGMASTVLEDDARVVKTIGDAVGDVFGATVNVAARLTAQARVGQMLTTRETAALMDQGGNVRATALGPTWLKNIAEPVDVFWIAEHTTGEAPQTLDPVCRMFVDADAAPARLPWAGRGWHFCSLECATAFAKAPHRYATEEA